MATSGSADFSLTRNEIIKTALLNVGMIGEGETPNATQYTDGAIMLNMIVKAWHADGMPLWALKQWSFSLSATASYPIGAGQTIATARPLRIYQAFTRHLTDFTDIPVEIITGAEYDSISNKTATGLPTKLYYDVQGTSPSYGTIYLWPIPDTTTIATRQCYIRYQRPFEDFDASSDTPDFPQEYFLALVWMLSWALGPAAGIPRDERKAWLDEAVMLKSIALSNGMEEGSLYIEPERY